MGLGTNVSGLAEDVFGASVVRTLSSCDVVMGCVDTVDARELLNRLCVYYLLPYIDVGVRLEADGEGGIEQIVGSVHYLHPEGTNLMERGLYTSKQLHDAGLRRTDPSEYASQVRAKYISGASEDRPAVVSTNMCYASLAVNELLARLHPIRDDGNTDIDVVSLSLTQMRMFTDGYPSSARPFARFVGRGDVSPLLGMPELSAPKRRKHEALA